MKRAFMSEFDKNLLNDSTNRFVDATMTIQAICLKQSILNTMDVSFKDVQEMWTGLSHLKTIRPNSNMESFCENMAVIIAEQLREENRKGPSREIVEKILKEAVYKDVKK